LGHIFYLLSFSTLIQTNYQVTMKFSTICLLSLASYATAFAPMAPSAKTSSALQSVLKPTTGQSQLDPSVIDKYSALPYPDDLIMAEYVWVDAEGNTRSKTRTLPSKKVGRPVDLLVCSTTAGSLYNVVSVVTFLVNPSQSP